VVVVVVVVAVQDVRVGVFGLPDVLACDGERDAESGDGRVCQHHGALRLAKLKEAVTGFTCNMSDDLF
jgi:hypothetical protein